jgi:tripartite-type tricarboxylate transporter receptor subunit TctC
VGSFATRQFQRARCRARSHRARARLADLGLEEIGNSPDEFAAVIESGIPKLAKVIKDAGIKAD